MAEDQPRTQTARLIGAAALVIAGLAAYGLVATNALHNGHTGFAEVGYLIRSWWYIAHVSAPYTSVDATWQMPAYFYALGWWQTLAGVGPVPARLLSVGLGLVSAIMLFFIARRLTGNVLASAAAVFLFLATPATTYAFSRATPVAAVSALHLAAILLLISSLGRPRILATIGFGLLCVAIFFTRQNLLPGLLVLIALYIAAIGRKRGQQSGVLLVTLAVASAAVLFSFPDRLAADALRLPVIAPLLSHWNLLPANYGLIQQGTTGATPVVFGIGDLRWADLLDTFMLPYAGIIVLAATVFVVAGSALRVLWIAPLYFFGLALVHFLASSGYCNGCMISDTPTFVAVGALSAALSLAVLASLVRRHDVPPAVVIVGGAILGAALSTFAPTLARNPAYRYFPAPELSQPLPLPELTEIDVMAQWIKATAPAHEQMLLLHNQPALPYAAFLGGALFPVQSIDPDGTRRVIKPRLAGATREAVQAAVEAESLWTDETLHRWLQRDFELVLFEPTAGRDQSALVTELTQNFDVLATHPFRGQVATLYRRKPVQ